VASLKALGDFVFLISTNGIAVVLRLSFSIIFEKHDFSFLLLVTVVLFLSAVSDSMTVRVHIQPPMVLGRFVFPVVKE
jgi:hypothetical protein